MPKGKGKQAGAAAEGGGGRGGAAKQKSLQSSTDDLPQVWLPNQVGSPAPLRTVYSLCACVARVPCTITYRGGRVGIHRCTYRNEVCSG